MDLINNNISRMCKKNGQTGCTEYILSSNILAAHHTAYFSFSDTQRRRQRFPVILRTRASLTLTHKLREKRTETRAVNMKAEKEVFCRRIKHIIAFLLAFYKCGHV